MAFHLLFLDSFDHYDSLSLKWTSVPANTSINLTGDASRTGIGCLYCGTPGGPQKALGVQTNFIFGGAFYAPVLSGRFLIFYSVAIGDEVLDLTLNVDGSVSMVVTGSHTPIANSGPGLVSANEYVYYEVAGNLKGGPGTQFFLKINGALVISVTIDYVYGQIDLLQPSGLFNDQGGFWDDLYIGYSDTPDNIVADMQGALRIYPYIPAANESPLNWTPLANTNWQETSQIPEPLDAAYVSSSGAGDIDQYELQPVSGEGPIGSFSIPFGQTVICAKLDSAGSGSVAPDIGGHVGASSALTTNYEMSTQPYLLNPVTGLPFQPSDFTSTFLGPKRTA
jgi:hypothetical protein